MSKNKHSHEEKNIKKDIFSEESVTEKEESKSESGSELENCECICEEKTGCHCGEEEGCGCDKKQVVDEEIIVNLNQQINVLKEALLRNQADLQNYKRRKEEESEKTLKYKNEDLIKELLSVVDNFERAIKMDDNDLSDEVSKFLAGFKLIYTNMINILAKFDVKEITSEGVEFDPAYHHAVLTEHDENKPAGVVLEVLQKGYLYKDRVIRPAMVKVNE